MNTADNHCAALNQSIESQTVIVGRFRAILLQSLCLALNLVWLAGSNRPTLSDPELSRSKK